MRKEADCTRRTSPGLSCARVGIFLDLSGIPWTFLGFSKVSLGFS